MTPALEKRSDAAALLADIKFRYYQEIQRFGGLMLTELMANQEKKGNFLAWLPERDDAKSELEHHFYKLVSAIDQGQRAKITEHCADMANIAMGIHRNLGAPLTT